MAATDPIGKALWLIESALEREIDLDEIAAFCGVSRYHLCRVFGMATGRSVMHHLRARRLTEAARRLAGGAGDILTVALDAGYGSHEAFTRAFRDQFGLTPEAVRAQGLDSINLVEPLRMDKTPLVDLEPPRFETGPTLLVAGIGGRFRAETNQGIPMLWQRLDTHLGHIGGQVGGRTYGVCCNADGRGNFDYIAGVEVSDFEDLPADFSRVRIGEQRYAVFTHRGHISAMRATVDAIWNGWLPNSGHQLAAAPDFERYEADFDARNPVNAVEIWLPIKG
ncbi:MAG TPA: AraC family transcriptional regulator [Aliidongia sp.]|nr:AraC family transcriptional regulator [Aliidongia sp.]